MKVSRGMVGVVLIALSGCASDSNVAFDTGVKNYNAAEAITQSQKAPLEFASDYGTPGNFSHTIDAKPVTSTNNRLAGWQQFHFGDTMKKAYEKSNGTMAPASSQNPFNQIMSTEFDAYQALVTFNFWNNTAVLDGIDLQLSPSDPSVEGDSTPISCLKLNDDLLNEMTDKYGKFTSYLDYQNGASADSLSSVPPSPLESPGQLFTWTFSDGHTINLALDDCEGTGLSDSLYFDAPELSQTPAPTPREGL